MWSNSLLVGALHHPRDRHLPRIETLLLSVSSIEKLKKLLLEHGEGDSFSLPQMHGTYIRLLM